MTIEANKSSSDCFQKPINALQTSFIQVSTGLRNRFQSKPFSLKASISYQKTTYKGFFGFQYYTKLQVQHLINSTSFRKPLVNFRIQRAGISGCETLRLQVINMREVPAQKEATPPSSLTGHFTVLSETSEDKIQEKRKKTPSFHHHSKSSLCFKGGPSQHLENYEIDMHEKAQYRYIFLCRQLSNHRRSVLLRLSPTKTDANL